MYWFVFWQGLRIDPAKDSHKKARPDRRKREFARSHSESFVNRRPYLMSVAAFAELLES
jgi:hypothetical protein